MGRKWGEATASSLTESLTAGSQAPRCPDNDGAALEPKWLRTHESPSKVRRSLIMSIGVVLRIQVVSDP